MMSDKNAIAFPPLDPNAIELPIPPDAVKDGFHEVATIWRRDDGSAGEQISVMVRPEYKIPSQWGSAIVILARTIIALHAQGHNLTPMQVEEATNELLRLAHVSLGMDRSEPMSSVSVLETPLTQDELMHPGELGLPEEVLADDRAVQILGIWVHPAIDDCDDCGDDHLAQTSICGRSEYTEPEDFGKLLAETVRVHAQSRSPNPVDQFKTQMVIEKAFYDHLSEGMVKT